MDLNLSESELKFQTELRAWLAANVPKGWDARGNPVTLLAVHKQSVCGDLSHVNCAHYGII
ncbi:MAG TPA: hypothetical protein VF532_20950 [Candidatus Angelobacter sp.]